MQPFLEITLTNVVMATGLALIAAVVAKMFRRPVLSHFLWLLVLLKLVTPPLIPVRLSQPAAARGWNAADNLTWACVAWFGGSVLWLVVAAARVYSFQRLLRHARPAPESLQFQAAILAQRMGLARCPTVTIVPGRVSPLL